MLYAAQQLQYRNKAAYDDWRDPIECMWADERSLETTKTEDVSHITRET